MIIKVLGTGCKNCLLLEKNVREAVEKMKSLAGVIKISSIDEIVDFGVMMVPALVINEEVVSVGKLLTIEKITELIKEKEER